MKLLLDTHVFLWFISGDGKLNLSFVKPFKTRATKSTSALRPFGKP